MKLIDTNVLIYAAGREHAYKEPCARLLARLTEGSLEANVTTEVLQELLHHYWAVRQLAFGLAYFDRLRPILPVPLPITKDLLITARNLLGRYPPLPPRDALHAATVLEYNLEGIISADKGFDRVKEVQRFDPKDLT